MSGKSLACPGCEKMLVIPNAFQPEPKPAAPSAPSAILPIPAHTHASMEPDGLLLFGRFLITICVLTLFVFEIYPLWPMESWEHPHEPFSLTAYMIVCSLMLLGGILLICARLDLMLHRSKK